MSLRIAHCGDLHFGDSYHLGQEGRGGVHPRLTDFRDAWIRSCRRMQADGVQLVLMAGDAFEHSKPTPTEQEAFRAGLDVLIDAGIPVLCIPGNHEIPRQVDRAHALEMFRDYRDLVTVIDRPGVVEPIAGVCVGCFPYPKHARGHMAAQDPEFESLTIDEQHARIVEAELGVLRKLSAEVESQSDREYAVLVAHGSISGSIVGAESSTAFFREPVLPLSELRGLAFDYQAWSHIHRAQALEHHIRYSGSLEHGKFEDLGDKGWWLVELSEGLESLIEWRSSEPRPVLDLVFSDPLQWEAELASLDGAAVGALVRVGYTTTPEVSRAVDQSAIKRTLYESGAQFVHGPIAHVVQSVTEAAPTLTEETDVWTGWTEYADGQGIGDTDRERLDRKVRAALEVAA